MDLAMAASSNHLQMLPPGDEAAPVARLPTAAVVATMEVMVVGPQTMAVVEVKKGDKTLKPIDQSVKCVANLVTLLSSAGIVSMKRTRKRRLLVRPPPHMEWTQTSMLIQAPPITSPGSLTSSACVRDTMVKIKSMWQMV